MSEPLFVTTVPPTLDEERYPEPRAGSPPAGDHPLKTFTKRQRETWCFAAAPTDAGRHARLLRGRI
jgi:hypothetical protein